MSKNVRIDDRIKVLEEKLRKSGNTLGKDAGLGNKTVDGWRDKNLDFYTNTIEIFLRHHKISKKWWDTGEGDIFISQQENKTNKLRDVDIIEAENYIGMHKRVYDSLEKSLEVFQRLAMDAQKQANDLTQILSRRSGRESDPPQAQ